MTNVNEAADKQRDLEHKQDLISDQRRVNVQARDLEWKDKEASTVDKKSSLMIEEVPD